MACFPFPWSLAKQGLCWLVVGWLGSAGQKATVFSGCDGHVTRCPAAGHHHSHHGQLHCRFIAAGLTPGLPATVRGSSRPNQAVPCSAPGR
jgi:hypothetical protein